MDNLQNSLIYEHISSKSEEQKVAIKGQKKSEFTPITFELTNETKTKLSKAVCKESQTLTNHFKDTKTDVVIKIPVECDKKSWKKFWDYMRGDKENLPLIDNKEALAFIKLHQFLDMNSGCTQRLSLALPSSINLLKDEYEKENIKRFIWITKEKEWTVPVEILDIKLSCSGKIWDNAKEYFKLQCAHQEKKEFSVIEIRKGDEWTDEISASDFNPWNISHIFNSNQPEFLAKYAYLKNVRELQEGWYGWFGAYSKYKIGFVKYPQEASSLFSKMKSDEMFSFPKIVSLQSFKMVGTENRKLLVRKEFNLPKTQVDNEIVNNILWTGDRSHIFIATTAHRLLSYAFNKKSKGECTFLKQKQYNLPITSLCDWQGRKTIFIGFENGYIKGMGYDQIDEKDSVTKMFFKKNDKPVRHMAINSEGTHMLVGSPSDCTVYRIKDTCIKEKSFWPSLLSKN